MLPRDARVVCVDFERTHLHLRMPPALLWEAGIRVPLLLRQIPLSITVSFFPCFDFPPPLLVRNHGAAGDYNVIIPVDAPAGYYSIRVGLFNDDAVYDCSDTFEVVV